MKDLKGTKTEKNLREALCGESSARNKYTYFSSNAKKEGFIQIAKIFEQTANNEKEHAKIWYKILYGIDDTEKNLKNALENEFYEYQTMYPSFKKEALEEGFNEIAELFDMVSKIEEGHYERFKKLYENIKNNTVFNSKDCVIWECSNCGYLMKGNNPPEKCPFCSHKKEYFEKYAKNY